MKIGRRPQHPTGFSIARLSQHKIHVLLVAKVVRSGRIRDRRTCARNVGDSRVAPTKTTTVLTFTFCCSVLGFCFKLTADG